MRPDEKPEAPGREAELLRLAHDVADGLPVDWSQHRDSHPELAPVVEGLEAIAALAKALSREPPAVAPGAAEADPGPGLLPGQMLGRFRVEREAGRGGMGIVYRARDEVLDRAVALKLLTPGVARSPERLSRFTREAKLLASLNHPNVATIHGLEEGASGLRYLVLEWVPGDTLAQSLERGPLPPALALDVCLQIGEALEAAHEGGVIHRDLKPGNVIITPQGRVKVLDFGLARSLGQPAAAGLAGPSDMTVAGTWGYVSPECLTGGEDHRADVFAFGCVLYECLAGVPAFPGGSAEEIQRALLGREPDLALLPGATPPAVRELVERCVEKDPERRLASMPAAVQTLARALGRQHVSLSRAAHPHQLPRPSTSFVGRGRDIEQCRDLLASSRLVTLSGTGGCGKTRLAIEVAKAVADTYVDGVVFADLTSVQDGGRVVDALAKLLGEREEPPAPLLARIESRLKTARALVVLDNCEHVLAACAEISASLIESCPGLTLLTTSREPLRVRDERVLVLSPLSVPSADDLVDPAAIARSDAVSLFLDRARIADPEFLPDEASLRAVGEICRRVEGLPLASSWPRPGCAS